MGILHMTIEIFRNDAYQKKITAEIVAINDGNGLILDQTIFYPTGGGQPGDSGVFFLNDDQEIKIETTVKSKETSDIIHVPVPGQNIDIKVGDKITAIIDWDRRYAHMKMHTAMHLLCALIPCAVTGGQVGAEKSRLDFDVGDYNIDKLQITQDLNKLINENHGTESLSITGEELDNQPDLVRTMSVQPPRINGEVRLVKIGETIDLQPCGGTHVRQLSEIGPVRIAKVENKGKKNRRINIIFDKTA